MVELDCVHFALLIRGIESKGSSYEHAVAQVGSPPASHRGGPRSRLGQVMCEVCSGQRSIWGRFASSTLTSQLIIHSLHQLLHNYHPLSSKAGKKCQ
jgi:hypothetical protein